MVFIFLLLCGFIFWIVKGRSLYINWKYGGESGIDYDTSLSKEELMEKFRKELNYPEQKELYYNENGDITIKGKFGDYSLRIENNKLLISKRIQFDYSSQTCRRVEEAECIKAYIQKVFNPDAPVNPSKKLTAMNKYNAKKKITTAALIAILIAAIAYILWQNGYFGNDSVQIKESYLTSYSQTVTIGDAFDEFFEDPRWGETYTVGSDKYIDFNGKCTYNNETAIMTITFYINGDYFAVQTIKINGTEMPMIMYDEFLFTIFNS